MADTSPESVALSFGGLRMTYGQLNAQADRLARNLRWLGVGPEVPVAVCLERSFEYVVSALAIWKAGGAYLPIDSSSPAERCATIIEDAGAPVLIARSAMLRSGLSSAAPFLVNLDSHSLSAAHAHFPVPSVETKRDQLAYISYTSGTTRIPKGVEITHGNLLNLVFWHRRAFGITASDRASHLAGLAFDAAAWELWPHLSAGATVVLLTDDSMRLSRRQLRDWIARERITVAFVPTTLAEPLMGNSPDTSWPKDTALRYLLTGSETLHRYPSAGLPFTLVNNYGPTECTVVATFGPVPPTDRPSTLPCIGTGIANTPIYLLDENLQPVAPGETGEIFIGGPNVGRWYRNRPNLTARHFLRDPFRAAPDARMYRSGDLGSKLPSGQIQFHGRLDQQQKIRGHRAEPDEVASVLARHSGLSSCAVIGLRGCFRSKASGLFRFQARDSSGAGGTAEIPDRQVPDYMIPAAFVRLDALPLNSSGKLNRAALPVLSARRTQGETVYRAPQSPFECQVANIVAQLLQLDHVGLDDNFFLLGGHSLLGTQLVLRARSRFGVELTLRHLLETQTVAKLAAEIERLVVAKLETMPEEEASRLLAALDGGSVAGASPACMAA
jgi:amino acid adenylation domain-containing protein